MKEKIFFDTEEKCEQLKRLCRMKPTLQDCAAFFDCHTTTIEKHVKEKYGISFTEFRDQNMVYTRYMIIRNILALCEERNLGALIYASKNLCGWADKVIVTPKFEDDTRTVQEIQQSMVDKAKVVLQLRQKNKKNRAG